MKDDIPDNIIKAILVAISVITWAFVGWSIYQGIIYQPKTINAPKTRIERNYAILEGNSLKPYVSPNNDFTGTKIVRVVTAYNPVKSQTDSTPCIAASGLNICETNKKIFASNEFEFGQKIVIDGVIWECQDRMNLRYNHRIDLLMYDYEQAKEWGKQIKEIILLN